MSLQTKHFLNSPSTLVTDSLHGLCISNPNLALDAENKVVYLASQVRTRVALVCGGGSGHEPAHAGFVGDGMLTAAVCGNVFASPSASQVRRAIDLVDNEKGVLIIVKNYTGDVLNFGLAKEQHAALHPSKANLVKFVLVGDDVAVGRTAGRIVGRRGLAGTVLVYKIAGALAEQGATLAEVHEMAEWVASRLATVGVSLGHCHVPGTAPTASYLSADEFEIGMGIHNESGHQRISPIPPLHDLIPRLLEMLTSTTDKERAFVPFQGQGKDNVVLLVNNLGGLSELEMGGIVAETTKALYAKGVTIQRVIAGTFMTSLNMPGFSITLLLLPPSKNTDTTGPSSSLVLSLLDQPCAVPGWKRGSVYPPAEPSSSRPPASLSAPPAVTQGRTLALTLRAEDPEAFVRAIERACSALIKAEPEITKMDVVAGDGDCGTTLKNGAEAVLSDIANGNVTGEDVVGAILAIAQVAEEKMGGTSGALFSIFFSSLAQGLQAHLPPPNSVVTSNLWSSALHTALDNLYTYTRARPPSRTLIDPLFAFVHEGLGAASDAAERTRDTEPMVGRSAYVDKTRLMGERLPDPGAWGVKVVLEALFEEMKR